MGPFTIDHQPEDHLLVVAGEVDAATAPQLLDRGLAALGAADTALDLDLAAVTFLDSTGLRALLTLNEAAQNAQVRLTLRRPGRSVTHLLQLMKLDTVFDLAM